MTKDLNGIVRDKPFDNRGRSDFRPLRESQCSGWTELKEEGQGSFVPKKDQPCHGEEKQRTRFEKTCRACRAAVAQSALEFAAKGRDLERLADFYLRKKGVRLNRKGQIVSPRDVEAASDAPQEFPKPQGFPRPDRRLK